MKNPIKSLRQNPTFNFWFPIVVIAVVPLYLWVAWQAYADEKVLRAILFFCMGVLFCLAGILEVVVARRRRSDVV